MVFSELGVKQGIWNIRTWQGKEAGCSFLGLIEKKGVGFPISSAQGSQLMNPQGSQM
jgi:hypothetical protein